VSKTDNPIPEAAVSSEQSCFKCKLKPASSPSSSSSSSSFSSSFSSSPPFSDSSSPPPYFTVGPMGFSTVGTAAYRLIVPPCFGYHLSPPGALRAQMARETFGREWENYG
jgi:hypothetical protein